MVRVGIGYDVHALVAGRPLILGGVRIEHPQGLEGHSDADVLLHALCDALLGSIGEGDIGQFFPDSDPRWKNASSSVFVAEAVRQIKARSGNIINVDTTLMAERPKISPFLSAIRASIADALGLTPAQVGVKATTNEKLGFLGRGEGMAALAVAAVDLPDGAGMVPGTDPPAG